MHLPVSNEGLCLSPLFKIMKINTFVVKGPPDPFNEDSVHPASLAVHGDFDLIVFEGIGKREAAELTPLIGVKDLWLAVLSEGIKAKSRIQSVRNPPRQNLSLRPVRSEVVPDCWTVWQGL